MFMSFAIVSICATTPKLPIEKQHKLELLDCGERAALITDLVIAGLVIVTAVLAIVAAQGVNLGALTGIGTLGVKAAAIMIGAAGAIILVDVIKLLVQMARHISHLFEINNRLASNTILQELQDRLAETNTKLSALNLEHDDLVLENKDLEKQTDHSKREIEAFRKLSEERDLEIQKLNVLLSSKTETADETAKKQIDLLKAELLDAQVKINITQAFDQVERLLEQKQKELAEIRDTQITAAQETVRKLNQEFLAKTQGLQLLEEKFLTLQGDHENLKKQHDQLQSVILQLKNEVIEQKKKVQAADEKEKQIIGEAQKKGEMLTLAAQEKNKQDRDEANKQLKAAEKKLEEHEAAIKKIDLEGAKKQLEGIENKIKQVSAEHADLLSTVKKLADDKVNLETVVLPELKQQADRLAETCKHAQEQADELLKKAQEQAKTQAAEILSDAQKEVEKLKIDGALKEAETILKKANEEASMYLEKVTQEAKEIERFAQETRANAEEEVVLLNTQRVIILQDIATHENEVKKGILEVQKIKQEIDELVQVRDELIQEVQALAAARGDKVLEKKEMPEEKHDHEPPGEAPHIKDQPTKKKEPLKPSKPEDFKAEEAVAIEALPQGETEKKLEDEKATVQIEEEKVATYEDNRKSYKAAVRYVHNDNEYNLTYLNFYEEHLRAAEAATGKRAEDVSRLFSAIMEKKENARNTHDEKERKAFISEMATHCDEMKDYLDKLSEAGIKDFEMSRIFTK
jgi:vacuolar-type H+-ATPase subunit H